ncbi:MAG: RNA 3'-terminal phosphate cyclase [Nitrososphaerales archaeon]|jgi:RNA 3'-phosphate cyclase
MVAPPVLEIDGSFGEGGGQTIRIATSFSIILGRPIRVTKVRAGRRTPGLRPQHAATLRILREVCGGSLEGGEIGSTEFAFAPGRPSSKSMTVDMGTAASITLVLQALIPAASLSGVELDLELVGGTDVPWSPTCDYVAAVLAASLRRLGMEFGLVVERRGYYPNGGGRTKVHIRPCPEILPIELPARVSDPPISLVSRAGMLPRRVAEQQASSATSQLARYGLSPAAVEIKTEESGSPGSSILVSAVDGSCFLGADSIGARGKPALRVGSEAAWWFAKSYATGACVDPHLADMLAPLLCLARSPSSLLTSEFTEHLRTSLHVAQQFVGADYTVRDAGSAKLLTITPRAK